MKIDFLFRFRIAALTMMCLVVSKISQAQCHVSLGILEIERSGSREIEFTPQDSVCIKDFCDRINDSPREIQVLFTIDYYFPKPSKNIILNVMAIKRVLLFYGVNETKILFKFHETDIGYTKILFSGSIYR